MNDIRRFTKPTGEQVGELGEEREQGVNISGIMGWCTRREKMEAKSWKGRARRAVKHKQIDRTKH